MRILFGLLALTMSFSVLAKDVSTTISELEYERSAQCYEINSTMNFCLNMVCVNYQTFQCLGNTESFKVKLQVVTKTLANGTQKETVKKVKFIK
jgi:hypothetical protein